MVSTSGLKADVGPAQLRFRPSRVGGPRLGCCGLRISVDQPVTQFVLAGSLQLCCPATLVDRGPRGEPSATPSGTTSRSAMLRTSRDIHVGSMNPVGDRGDRHFRRIEARPQRGEHFSTDLAVQPGHAVGPLTEPEAHVCHVENVGVFLPALGSRIRSIGTPRMPARCTATSERGNRSMPAGTGVWVGRTSSPARTVLARPSSKLEVVGLDESRMTLYTSRNPAWPSLVWNTCGAIVPVAAQ